MVKATEALELATSDTEIIIQECRERIRQALDTDVNKVKEKAERDSNQIIARAKEEAERTIAQARLQARIESDRIIARAKDEAEQIVRKSSEEATEVRQESARVISETREKALQIIKEAIECGTSQAQSQFARSASEARNKASQLITQISTTLEQIIGETENNMKSELESLADLLTEAEVKLQPLREIEDKKTEEHSQLATPEEVNPNISVNKITEMTFPTVEDKQDAPTKDNDDTRLYKGCLKLEIIPPFGQQKLAGVPEWLTRMTSVKVISTDGYARANRWITTYNIDLKQPMPLRKILNSIPAVKDVTEHQGNFVITVK